MIEPVGGLLMILFGVALMLVPPIHIAVSRPKNRIERVAPALKQSFPAPVPTPDLTELVRMADEALAKDPLIRATAALRDTFDKA